MLHLSPRSLCSTLVLWLALWGAALAQEPAWPVWSAPTADGREFHSRSLEGKVVVVSVWTTACGSCRKQMPLLSKLQRNFDPSDLQVLSFSLDRSQTVHDDFVDEVDLDFPAIFARTGPGLNAVKLLQNKAGALEAVPTLLVFDRRGRLIHRSVGFVAMSKLESLVAPLLALPSADSR